MNIKRPYIYFGALVVSLSLLFLMGCLQIGQPVKSAENITYGELKAMGGQIECTYTRSGQSIRTVLTNNLIYGEKGENIILYGKNAEYITTNSSMIPTAIKKPNCEWYSVYKDYVWSGTSNNDSMRTYLDKITESRGLPYSNLSCAYSRITSIKLPTHNVCELD